MTDVDDLDFEDKLALFEKKFCKSSDDGVHSRSKVSHGNDNDIEQTGLTPSEVEMELRGLLKEFISCIPTLQNMAVSSDETDDVGFNEKWLRSEVSREIFRTEIRTTVSQLRRFQSVRHEQMEHKSSAQNSNMRSLKRMLAERTEELEGLQKKHSALEKERRDLLENVDRLTSSLCACKVFHVPLKEEVTELREENKAKQKTISENEEAMKRNVAERARFQSTIARYREELQLANHHAETVELDAKHAKEESALLKERAREAMASSSAVSARIKELQDVQDAMLHIMQDSSSKTDKQKLRRNLEDLNETRSRLVGKIANLLTGKRRGGTRTSDPSSPRSVNSHAITPKTKNVISTTGAVGDAIHQFAPAASNSNSSNEHAASPSQSASSRKFFENLRKFGGDLVKKKSNQGPNETFPNESPRQQRQFVLENVERSRVAIENDVALRGVIEMKENEIHRMEKELNDARERTAELEICLQKERHKRRLENRSINNSDGQKMTVEASSATITHRKSLFDWQTGKAKNGHPISRGEEIKAATSWEVRPKKMEQTGVRRA
ncbi:unnamed protein product [Chondrus crispus]|uniref:Uncharacterized protein n=1 Tax=Chondrus crispus TaxID=2769 RepID=R7QI44_CHOCR|nr:unnamed protein product [Chondrus crispus]CDF37428.1 unnamed protein product [Chondrus crispus]|eukprot:XP_005717247.1 unnamed protein product [Chondrus crispus]